MNIIGYLSGAPRVSTLPEAEATGPKSHILGIINAFENLGWQVKPFIVGNQMPKKVYGFKSRSILTKNIFTRFIADIFRIVFGFINENKAINEVGSVQFVYERFGIFQHLGRVFQKNKIPWVLETNGPFFSEASEERKSLVLKNIARKMELMAYKNCDLLVCVTDELKKIIIEEFDITEHKIVVIPNGVDIHHFNPENVNPIRFFDLPTIGFVGAIIRRQGIDLLIKALSELNQKGIKYGLVIIGEGSEKNKLIDEVNTLGLQNQVKFTGFMPREVIPAYISGFDIGYSGQIPSGKGYLSRMYHSPLKIYEYLAMGKPVLATAFDDAKKILENSEVGYLLEPGSLKSLIQTLEWAFNQREKWKTYGLNARILIEENHSWESRVVKIINLIEEKISLIQE
jgi:glycosyltransferase involved in cell wall biosynthesis